VVPDEMGATKIQDLSQIICEDFEHGFSESSLVMLELDDDKVIKEES
jgi:hypothetical protein